MPRNADDNANVTADDMHDLYDQNSRDGNIEAIWEWLTDSNMDLTAGDLGKVDLVSSKDDRKTADDERTIAVEECPSGTTWAPRDGFSADGTGTTATATALDGTGARPQLKGLAARPASRGRGPPPPPRPTPTARRTTTSRSTLAPPSPLRPSQKRPLLLRTS